MTQHDESEAVEAFVRRMMSAFQRTLNVATGTSWRAVQSSVPAMTEQPELTFRITLEGESEGTCSLGITRDHAGALVAKLAAREPAEDALLHVLEDVTAALADDLSVTARVEPAAESIPGATPVAELSLAEDAASVIVFTLAADRRLLHALLSRNVGANQGSAAAFDQTNLNLVMDVELNVSLRFGQRQLPLREVVKLTSGSVVELDRQVEEPVELLLDGKVIARGEAVIVDGNYGLRITEVSQPLVSQLMRG